MDEYKADLGLIHRSNIDQSGITTIIRKMSFYENQLF